MQTSESWQYHELLAWFIDSCWEIRTAAFACGLLQRFIVGPSPRAALDFCNRRVIADNSDSVSLHSD